MTNKTGPILTAPVTLTCMPITIMYSLRVGDRIETLSVQHYEADATFVVLHEQSRTGSAERFHDEASAVARFHELRKIIGHMEPVRTPR